MVVLVACTSFYVTLCFTIIPTTVLAHARVRAHTLTESQPLYFCDQFYARVGGGGKMILKKAVSNINAKCSLDHAS